MTYFLLLLLFFVNIPVSPSSVLQCAEGFLQAALKAETAAVMSKSKDGETAAKKSCKSATRSINKTTKKLPE